MASKVRRRDLSSPRCAQNSCASLASWIRLTRLNLFAELRLDLENVVLDAVYNFRLGPQRETFHAPTGFVDDKQQVSAATNRNFFHGAAYVEV